MSRTITNPTKEEKRIARLSSSLSPIDIYDNKLVGMSYDDFGVSIEDAFCYNDCYYVNGSSPSWREYQYSVVIDKCKEYVVLRYIIFDMTYNAHRCCYHPVSERSGEVFQRWLTADGREYVMARPMLNKHYAYWRIRQPMRLVKDAAEYNVDTCLEGLGIASLKRDYYKFELYERLCGNSDVKQLAFGLSPMGEWLRKCHRKLYAGIVKNAPYVISELMEHERQFRIAMRGHYRFTHKNIKTWLDYAKMLQDNLPNAAYQRTYLCPQDLEHAHDWITRIDIKRRAKAQIAAKTERAKAALQNFLTHHAELMNINIGDGNIELHSLNSPLEYVEEGAMMHHCVGGYYDKPESLIFSARDKQTGERIATIEVNIITQDIVQVRGICNKDVKEKNEICDIIKGNMPLIKERINKQRKEVA